ncbi:MAG: signal peptidase II [Candidatus Woesearchaeota archaeon]
MKKNKTLIFLLLLLVLLDQITKQIFSKQTIDLGLFAFRKVTNTGMSFGLFQGNNLIFIVITTIFIALIIYFRKEFKENKIALTLIIAGAIGNLIDRIIHGHVIDFIDFKTFPVFNVADSIIFIGVMIIIYTEIKNIKKEQNKTKKQKINN